MEEQVEKVEKTKEQIEKEEKAKAETKKRVIGIEHEVIEFILQRKYFYGYFLQQFKRHVTYDVDTLGVNITSDLKPNLYINPDFYDSLTKEQKLAVLEHEILHILNKHLVRREARNPYVWNLATDLAINQYIKDLPDGGFCLDCNRVIPKNGNVYPTKCNVCGKELDPKKNIWQALDVNTFQAGGNVIKLPKEQSSEVYYNTLWDKLPKVVIHIGNGITMSDESQKKDSMGEDGNGSGEKGGGGRGFGAGYIEIDGEKVPIVFDDHGVWAAGSDNQEMSHEKIKDMVQKTVNKMREKSQGHMPSHLQSLIDECLAHKTITWKTVLRRFVGYEEFADWIPSRKRMNKRFPMMMGSTVRMKAHIMVAVDTSGSISDDELGVFFREISVMSSAGVKITICECDADVQNVYEYRPKKQKIDCKGRGGTSFQPPFKFAHEKEYKNYQGEVFKLKRPIDGIVYLTDGYGDYPKFTKYPTLWVYTPHHSDYGWRKELGTKIVLDDSILKKNR